MICISESKNSTLLEVWDAGTVPGQGQKYRGKITKNIELNQFKSVIQEI